MNRILGHIRHNVVAYLALFVALGGTSYAAVSLPRNSVGARQLRNHSITAVKLNQKSIAASVRAWVKLQWNGSRMVALESSSRVTVTTTGSGEAVSWPHQHFARQCVVSVTPQVTLNGNVTTGYVSASFDPTNPPGAFLSLFGVGTNAVRSPQAADVLVFCP